MCVCVYVRGLLWSYVTMSVDGRVVPLICEQPTFWRKIKGTLRLGGRRIRESLTSFSFMVERVAVVYNTLTAILIKIFRDYNFLKTGLNKQDPPTHYNMILQRGTVTILKYHRRSLTDSAEVGLSLTETEIQQYKIFK